MRTRREADPDRVAVVLPGSGYSPAHPLLYYAGAILAHQGWSVQEVWWQTPEFASADAAAQWVHQHAAAALDAEHATRLMLIGKSLGSLAAPVAAERELPAVWLTPLLTNSAVVDALAATRAPTLLIGGAADRLWDSAAAAGLPHPSLEIPGADHSLETGDPLTSINVLKQVTARIADFAAALEA